MSIRVFSIIGLFLLILLTTATLAAQSTSTSAASSASPRPPYLDPSLPLDQRVNDLISRMTLEEKVSQMQDVAPAIPRLGIPAYNWWNEGLHDVARAGSATVFPQAIGLAATWDTDLVHRVADVISTEARASTTMPSSMETPAAISALRFGLPTSTSFAIRAGGAARKPTEKIPFSPAASAWPSSPAFRATIPNT